MTALQGFFTGLYLGLGWLFARQVQKQSSLDSQQFNHALLLLLLTLLWPLAVVFMLIVMSMMLLFPRIKK